MAGMQMGPNEHMNMQPGTFLEEIAHHATSGTSAQPDSTPAPMLMTMHGAWMVMFHANVFVTDEQQSSPRGGDKFFSTNWFMPMVQRRAGPGTLTARVMLSLEPATVGGRRYPLLFQQGETAYGTPISDGQHPHERQAEHRVERDLPAHVLEGWTQQHCAEDQERDSSEQSSELFVQA